MPGLRSQTAPLVPLRDGRWRAPLRVANAACLPVLLTADAYRVTTHLAATVVCHAAARALPFPIWVVVAVYTFTFTHICWIRFAHILIVTLQFTLSLRSGRDAFTRLRLTTRSCPTTQLHLRSFTLHHSTYTRCTQVCVHYRIRTFVTHLFARTTTHLRFTFTVVAVCTLCCCCGLVTWLCPLRLLFPHRFVAYTVCVTPCLVAYRYATLCGLR